MSVETRKPDFLMIGAAKSGTTTLWQYLDRHPGICMPQFKEPGYYSLPEFNSKGLDWYVSLFDDAKPGQLWAEASTTYTRWPVTLDSPKLMHEHGVPGKFVYILRNPIDRAYSHYGHHMRLDVTMSFEQAIAKDDIYCTCSEYMRQIERYLRYYPADSILCLDFVELRNQPAAILSTIQAFLGLEQHDLTDTGEVHRNAGTSDHYIRERTTQWLRTFPGVDFVADRIPESVRDKAYEWIRKSAYGRKLDQEARLQPMLPETRQRLLDYFEPHNIALERHLGVEFPHWRK
jgi:hypothetical protein